MRPALELAEVNRFLRAQVARWNEALGKDGLPPLVTGALVER